MVRDQFHTLILCTRILEAYWDWEAHWHTSQCGWAWALETGTLWLQTEDGNYRQTAEQARCKETGLDLILPLPPVGPTSLSETQGGWPVVSVAFPECEG